MVTVSLVVPEKYVSEDSGAVLVLVELEGDLEVDITVSIVTQNGTGTVSYHLQLTDLNHYY